MTSSRPQMKKFFTTAWGAVDPFYRLSLSVRFPPEDCNFLYFLVIKFLLKR